MDQKRRLFCHHYVQTADVERAARRAGATLEEALDWLERPQTVKYIQRMGRNRAAALSEEQTVNRLLSLLAGSPRDVVKLAFLPADSTPEALDNLDFSQLAECKRLSNGTVELKLIDRVGALLKLADGQKNGDAGLAPLLQALSRQTVTQDGERDE